MRGVGSALVAAIVLPLVIASIVAGVLLLRQQLAVEEIVHDSRARVAYAGEVLDPTTLRARDYGAVLIVAPGGELKMRRVSPGETLALPQWSKGWIVVGPVAKPLRELVNTSQQIIAGEYLDPWLVEAYRQGLVDAATVEVYRGKTPLVVNETVYMGRLVYTQNSPRRGTPASRLPYPLNTLTGCVMWYYNASEWFFVVLIPKQCWLLTSYDYELVEGYVCQAGCARIDPALVYRSLTSIIAKLWLYNGHAFIAWAYKPEWAPLGSWSIGATVAWNTTAPASLAVNARLKGYLSGQYYEPVYSIGIRVEGLGLLLPQLTSLLQSMAVVRGKAALGLDFRGNLVVRDPIQSTVSYPEWIPYDFVDDSYFRDPINFTLYMLVFSRP